MSHAATLREMLDFKKRLFDAATRVNGPSPEWEADRLREIAALEFALALMEKPHAHVH